VATIFTRIIKGEIPSYRIAENENFCAFLDINPLKKGHTLVVPKLEVDYLFDLDDETYRELFAFAKKVAKAMKSSLACKKIGVVVLGMEVPHVHIHLIPINNEGDMNFNNLKLSLTHEELSEICVIIKKNVII